MKTLKKRVCVVGLGQFGRELAVSFAPLCEVMAVDINPEIVNHIVDKVHSATVVDARDYASLSAVVSKDFDVAIVGLSENMEASVLAVLHLKKIGVARVFAKARSQDHASILEAVGADVVIFPERDTARRLARQVMHQNLLDYVPVGDDYAVMRIHAPARCIGRTLQELDLRPRFGIFVISIDHEADDSTNFLPGPEAILTIDSVMSVIGKPEDVEKMQKEMDS